VNTHKHWRPSKTELAKAVTLYARNPNYWVRARLRVLSALRKSPKASDAELAKGANVKVKTVANLFRSWEQDGMKEALEGFGRRPELSENDLEKLKLLIAVGKLKNPEEVQERISHTVLDLEPGEVYPLAKADALYRKALGIWRHKPEYEVPAQFIKELRLSRPEVAEALAQIVTRRISVRGAANRYGGDESTLRYYLGKAAEKKEARHLSRAFLFALYDWCDRQKKVTVASVRGYLAQNDVRNRSDRSIHRYIQAWKDSRGIKRRSWTCGGSKWS
jgi:hypothetical protein